MLTTENILYFLIFICLVILLVQADRSGGIIAGLLAISGYFKKAISGGEDSADSEQEKNELKCECSADCHCRQMCDKKCECCGETQLNCSCAKDCPCHEECDKADICDCFKKNGGCVSKRGGTIMGGFSRWFGGDDGAKREINEETKEKYKALLAPHEAGECTCAEEMSCHCYNGCECKTECNCECCDVPRYKCYCQEDCKCRPKCNDIYFQCPCEKKFGRCLASKEEAKPKEGGFFDYFNPFSLLRSAANVSPQSKTGSHTKCGAADIDFLNNEDTSVYPLTTMDTKNITAAKLRSAANKLPALEAFVDKLVNNTIILIKSLKKAPTDMASSMLANHKTLLGAAADHISKKPESRFSAASLRELAKRASDAITQQGEITKLGNISREELAIRYAALNANNGANTSVDLMNCQRDNEFLRRNNEKMREEMRRGLSNYTCEIMLRDCLAERDRLRSELSIGRNDSAKVRELQNEISDLHGIIRALQEEERKSDNLDSQFRGKIDKLENDLRECNNIVDDILRHQINEESKQY